MNVSTVARNRVLIIGSDAQSQDVALELQSAGFQVLRAKIDHDGPGRATNASPHLVVLNAGACLKDPMELLSTLRESVPVPIIVVGPDGEMPLLQSLLLGADIYLTPEISPRESLAYVRALLRRHAPGRTQCSGPPLQAEISSHAPIGDR